MVSDSVSLLLDFDIDRYLNPFIPHNRLYILPSAVSRWLGYRSEPAQEPYKVVQWPITILATVAGLCLIGGIGNYAPGIVDLHPPVIIASLGASAILEYNTIESPLSQPRNAIIGNTLAAICGVAIAKLFQLNSDFNNIQWVSGAVACALASWIMGLTNTIHPPGGATAVLASTEAMIIKMGWWFVPIVLLDSVLLVVVACIFNNIARQYPVFWWTSQNVGKKLRQEQEKTKSQAPRWDNESGQLKDAEKGTANSKKTTSDTSSERTLRRELSHTTKSLNGQEDVRISPYDIQLPRHVVLSNDEMLLLQKIQGLLRLST